MKFLPVISGIILTALVWIGPNSHLFDFSLVWKSAQILSNGGNPYARPHYSTIVQDYPDYLVPDPNGADVPTYYPPWSIAALLPFSIEPLAVAKKMYLTFSLVVLIGGWYLLLDKSALNSGYSLLLFPWGFALCAYDWGSLAIFPLVGTALMSAAIRRKAFFLAGLALSMALFKPHLLGILVAYLVGNFKDPRARRIIFGTLMGLGLTSALAMIFRPGVFFDFANFLRANDPLWMTNASLPSFVTMLVGGQNTPLPIFISALFTLAALAFALARRDFGPDGLVILLPIVCLLSPFAWGHDYLILLPTFAAVANGIAAGGIKLPSRPSLLFLGGNLLALLFAIHFFVPGWSYVLPAVLIAVGGRGSNRQIGQNDNSSNGH